MLIEHMFRYDGASLHENVALAKTTERSGNDIDELRSADMHHGFLKIQSIGVVGQVVLDGRERADVQSTHQGFAQFFPILISIGLVEHTLVIQFVHNESLYIGLLFGFQLLAKTHKMGIGFFAIVNKL